MSEHAKAGTRIGDQYVLRNRLGKGGMGEIWLANNLATGGEVAVKLLGKASYSCAARLRQEARLTASLTHRNIVTVYDLVEGEGILAIVMEYLRGETLEDYLEREERMDAGDALAVLLPILAALEHAHDAGVLHRDVTPANIFLAVDPDGQVTPKLLDFGIAKVKGGGIHTTANKALGTPAYMSPEQIRATGPLDARSDLFSFAAVLYQTISGVSPFGGSPVAAIFRTVPEDARIDAALWGELRRALAKDPGDRHGSAAELAAALRGVADVPPIRVEVSIRPPPPPPPEAKVALPRTSRKRPSTARLFGAAGILALLVISGARAGTVLAGQVAHAAYRTLRPQETEVRASIAPERTTPPSLRTAMTRMSPPKLRIPARPASEHTYAVRWEELMKFGTEPDF